MPPDVNGSPEPDPLADTVAAGETVRVEEAAPPPRRPPKLWPWLLALLVLVLGGLLAYWLVVRDDGRTTVPDVVGMTEAEAVARLEEEGLEADVDRVPSDRDEGTVVDETPGPGTEVDDGSTVELEVSDGPPPVTVPSVVSLPEERAVDLLEQAGLEPAIQRVFAGAPEGVVVEQSPEGGGSAPTGSTVELKVSKGRNLTPIPDVVGLDEEEAVSRLEDDGFEARIFDVPSTEPEGTVVAQDPPGGEQAPPDSSVRINVSSGEPTGEEEERPPVETPDQVTVPDVVGLAQTRALRRLRFLGLLGIVSYETSDEGSGNVLQQDPASGETAGRNAQVRIVVSTGPDPGEEVQVPDVRGQTLDTARQALEDAGFEVGVIRLARGGSVREQQPAAGVTSHRGAVVTIFVG